MSRHLTFPNQNNDDIETHYQMGDQLGSGAFSVVVKGVQLQSKTPVAVKIVDKEQTNREEMYSELAVMSRLSHSNIVNYFEIFEKKDNFYVVMELITGGELFDRIIELRHYSEKDASKVMYQALLGLKHMHNQNLIHRDLKPENLLLASKEPGADVKLADFGFATTCAGYELDDMVGTPPYMAPELALLRTEDVKYGKPVDVWAMGVVLYILLSGIHPFQIEDEDLMLDNIQSGKWSWLGPHWAKISKDAQELISHMLDISDRTRYTVDQCLAHRWFKEASAESIGDVAEAIKNFQAKKKLKGAIFGVLAAGKMKNLMASLKGASSATATGSSAAAPATQAAPASKAPVASGVASKVSKANKLEVIVISGKNLAPRDANGKSDPYLRLFYGQTRLKTAIQKKTLNPNWKSESFFVPMEDNENTLRVQCWDWDLIGSDEFMGEVCIDLSKIPVNTPVTESYNLGPSEVQKSKKGEADITGSVQLTIQKSTNY